MVTVFVSHSGKDLHIVEEIEQFLNNLDVNSIVIGYNIEGKPPMTKIKQGIGNSHALLLSWTSNVADNQDTRDIINAEIGGANQRGIPIFCFLERGVDKPWFISEITDYGYFSNETIIGDLKRVETTLINMKNREGLNKLIIAGLIIGILILAFSG